MSSRDSPYASASELADYAYCPRSHWYRTRPPPEGPAADALRRSTAGTRSHARQLGGERRRAERGVAYWALIVVGLLSLVGGVAWLL